MSRSVVDGLDSYCCNDNGEYCQVLDHKIDYYYNGRKKTEKNVIGNGCVPDMVDDNVFYVTDFCWNSGGCCCWI